MVGGVTGVRMGGEVGVRVGVMEGERPGVGRVWAGLGAAVACGGLGGVLRGLGEGASVPRVRVVAPGRVDGASGDLSLD